MKILLVGGGTAGHFNPLIAVAQEINALAKEQKLVQPQLYYFADRPYDERLLFENNISFDQIPAGKTRRYFSLLNFFDFFRTLWGIFRATWRVYLLYPDVIFSKGGYASFPVLVAARLLGIPVVIHESDSRPGRVNLWSGKFAKRIAVSYPEALKYFPKDKTAVTGNPIRQELLQPVKSGALEFLKLEPNLPIIFITGGSQGSQAINEAILAILPELIKRYQVIHQVGAQNLSEIKSRSGLALEVSSKEEVSRYHLFDYLNESALRMVAGVASLVVSRAGSVVFEFAQWGLPSIIIPIPEAISHDQKTNAFTYARSGGAVVIEQENLTPSVLLSEIERIVSDPKLQESLRRGAKSFARPEAGRLIAEAILGLGLEHEE